MDVIIIGGGPAGLSAALWCSDLGLRAILLEKASEFGGKLLQIYNPIRNYIGIETADGREMRDAFLNAAKKQSFMSFVETDVAEIDVNELTVRSTDGISRTARALIFATGVRRRKLGVPGEEKFASNGIIESGSRDKELVAGKRVAIVGGGDAAIENALILSEYASEVHVIHRRAEFRARAEFFKQARKDPKVHFHTESVVKEFSGDGKLTAVEIEIGSSGERQSIPVDNVLIRIGVVPNSEMLRGKVELDSSGFVIVDRECKTSIAVIFAIGDVANPISPTISTAAGTGATAAKAVFSLLNHV